MPTTVTSGIVYDELIDTRWSVGPEGLQATRYLAIDAADYSAFVEDCLGWSELTGAGPTTAITRKIPEIHPLWHRAYAVNVEFIERHSFPVVDPALNDALMFDGEIAVAVTYRRPDFRIAVDGDKPVGVDHEMWRYVRRLPEMSVQGQPYPESAFIAASEPAFVVPEPPVKMVPGGTVRLSLLQVPCVLDSWGVPRLPTGLETSIRAVVGKTNTVAFDNGKHPTYTLFCDAPALEWHEMSNGDWACHVHYIFQQRGLTGTSTDPEFDVPNWQRTLRADGKWWDMVLASDVSKGPFGEDDFHRLFRMTGV